MTDIPMTPRQQRTHSRLSEEIKGIHQELGEVIDETKYEVRGRIKEEYFVQGFLPFFAGDKNVHPKINMGLWGSIAKNVYREVDVVDEEGNILFTVPPIFNRNHVTPSSPRGDMMDSFNHIVQTTQQLSLNSPHQAEGYMNSMIHRKKLLQGATTEDKKNAETWNNIFTRYGRPTPFAITDEKAKVETVSINDMIDDFEI